MTPADAPLPVTERFLLTCLAEARDGERVTVGVGSVDAKIAVERRIRKLAAELGAKRSAVKRITVTVAG
jgi:hypothetical protein